jgi:hypothetical protein
MLPYLEAPSPQALATLHLQQHQLCSRNKQVMAHQPIKKKREMSVCSELQKQHAKQGKSYQNMKPVELEEYAPLFGALGHQELIQQGFHHPFEQHQ